MTRTRGRRERGGRREKGRERERERERRNGNEKRRKGPRFPLSGHFTRCLPLFSCFWFFEGLVAPFFSLFFFFLCVGRERVNQKQQFAGGAAVYPNTCNGFHRRGCERTTSK